MAKKTIRLRRWKIKVFQDDTYSVKPVNYIVIAVNELDARTIAFCLDGGFSKSLVEMKSGHIELVKTYTKVLGISNVYSN